MAKKKVLKTGELPDVMSMMKSIDDQAEILKESETAKINEWIPSGFYMFDAMCSGSILKGAVPSGRILGLYGVSGSAKSFISCSICREAIKMKDGYNVLYLDSENSIDNDFMERLGVDTTKVIIRQVGTIQETTQIITHLIDKLKEEQEEYGEHHKFFIVLDSLGQLSDIAEEDIARSGENKANMQKNKGIKMMFRAITNGLGHMQIPMVVVSHSYQNITSFIPGSVMSGGTGIQYSASIIAELFPSKLDDKETNEAAKKLGHDDSNTKNGINVTAKCAKNRFARPKKIQIQIPFYKSPNPYIGLEAYCNWNICKICRGNMINEKEFDKLGGESETVHSFEFNGEKMYCQEKETARGIIVARLGKQVSFKEFFTPEVFTREILEELDEKVIRPTFELPKKSSMEDIESIENDLEVGNNVTEEIES
jgi:RecA/RadA recombinase